MPVFESSIELLTPFGPATCMERVDYDQNSFWICWPKETGICFWFPNPEVRFTIDWSDSRYEVLPFNLSKKRIQVLDVLGKHHSYWRDNIHPGKQKSNGD